MARSFLAGLIKAGLVSPEGAVEASDKKSMPVGGESPATPPAAPANNFNTDLSADPASYPEWALRWAVAGIELLGRKRLEQGLEDAMATGASRDAQAFCRRVESALDALPSARAAGLRAEMADLWNRKGYPTFCGRARTVLEASQSGAVDAWLSAERDQATAAEALVIPKPEEGEDLDVYSTRLEVWAGDKPGALLKRIGFDAGTIVRTERDQREAAEADRAKKIVADAKGRFVAGGSYEDLVAATDVWSAREIAAETPRAWEVFVAGKIDYISAISAPPPAEWLATQKGFSFLILAATGAREEFRPAFRAQLLAALPARPGPGQAAIVHVKDEALSISANGQIQKRDGQYGALPAPGIYATEPSARGWVEVRDSGFRFHGPTVFAALTILRGAKPGEVLIDSEVANAFSRHPQQNYPRLRWEISAGSDKSSFELPLQEGELARHVEALKNVLDAGLEPLIPGEAWWLNATLGTTAAGRPRLNNGRAPTAATIVVRKGHEMSHGRHGWKGTSVDAGPDRPGAKFLWKGGASSRGGGNSASAIVAWIEDGATLALASGIGIRFDGAEILEIPGAGLDSPKE